MAKEVCTRIINFVALQFSSNCKISIVMFYVNINSAAHCKIFIFMLYVIIRPKIIARLIV